MVDLNQHWAALKGFAGLNTHEMEISNNTNYHQEEGRLKYSAHQCKVNMESLSWPVLQAQVWEKGLPF